MSKATKPAPPKKVEDQTPIADQADTVIMSPEDVAKAKEGGSFVENFTEGAPIADGNFIDGGYTGDADPLKAVEETTKPVTMAGKAVPVSASGKVRLLDTRKNRIITGLIDLKRAQDQVAQFSHIEILNEAEAFKYEK